MLSQEAYDSLLDEHRHVKEYERIWKHRCTEYRLQVQELEEKNHKLTTLNRILLHQLDMVKAECADQTQKVVKLKCALAKEKKEKGLVDGAGAGPVDQ